MGVKSLGLGTGHEILVPAYHCGSEVEALIQAGIACRFYDVGRYLEPDENELEALLGTRVRALYLTHVLGFPQDAAHWRAWCDRHGLLLIEDAAQAWLSFRNGTLVGSHGDLSVFSPLKTLGLPDGALVISRRPPKALPFKYRVGIRKLASRHGSYLKQRWSWLNKLRRQFYWSDAENSEFDPKIEFALDSGGDPTHGPYISSNFLLKRVPYSRVQSQRAANYSFLHNRLKGLVPDHFPPLVRGASPFAFPLKSDRKAELLSWLEQHGVIALNFWSVPHPCLPATEFPRAAELRESIIGLPVHQELSRRDLEWIVVCTLNGLRFLS
jgi:perosamine synthetase